jgi:hypothetical protein
MMNRTDPLAGLDLADLMRKAREIRLAANRASPTLSAQLLTLAALYETRAQDLEAVPAE